MEETNITLTLPAEPLRNVRLDELTSIVPYATLRRRDTAQLPIDEHADAIASHFQLSNRFMKNDAASELLRIQTLKAMPQCLVVKRSVKSKLEATITIKSKQRTLSQWRWFKYKLSFLYGKACAIIYDIIPRMELWYHSIRTIEGRFGSGVATYFKFLRWLIVLNSIFCLLCISFIIVPQSMNEAYTISPISGWDFFTGSGFFTNSIMYYGFYDNSTIQKVEGSTYHIPSAYFLTLFFSYVLMFVILSVKVLRSYQKSYVDIRGKAHNLYSNKIFCGWDFSISSSKAATLQSASIYRDLIELLAESKQSSSIHWWIKLLRFFVQIGVTIMILIMTLGIGILLWILLDLHRKNELGSSSTIILPVIVTIILNLSPIIISYSAKYEKYSRKRTELYVTVIRTHLISVTVIVTLFLFWLINSGSGCWQTELGEEIYRLIIVDLFISIFGVYIIEAIRSSLWKNTRRPKFNIAFNIVNLMYNQILFWLGCYFSPVISVIIILKMLLIFYIKKHGLLVQYDPPPRPWRAAQTQTLFLALAFLGIIGVIIALGYVITNVQCVDCGPFRGYNYTWEFVTDGVLALEKDSAFWKFVSDLTTPAPTMAILICMCIGVYCLRAKAEASRELVHILKQMLIMQAKDKEFLLKNFPGFREHNCVRMPEPSSSSDVLRNNIYLKT